MKASLALAVLAIAVLPPVVAAQNRHSLLNRSVALARIHGRAIAPVCPTLVQLRDRVETQKGRWNDRNIGCGHVLAGNFEGAQVIADSGKYVQVRFMRKDAPSTNSWMHQGGLSRDLWTTRDRFVARK
ncbi:MAG: hypothetical protein ABI141_05115 [Gemmatimonadaceae bacterium]